MRTISTSLQDIPSGDPPVITDIFIDTVGDPEFYKSRLTSALGKDFGRFVIEKKADATYKVVSAASIIAKVTSESDYFIFVTTTTVYTFLEVTVTFSTPSLIGDSLLKHWVWAEPSAASLSKDFGSGYPSDETCVKW